MNHLDTHLHRSDAKRSIVMQGLGGNHFRVILYAELPAGQAGVSRQRRCCALLWVLSLSLFSYLYATARCGFINELFFFQC